MLSIGLRFSNGTEMTTEFMPQNVDIAIDDFVDLVKTQNDVLNNEILAKALVKKSDIRPLRKSEFVAYWNNGAIKTRLKMTVKPSKFTPEVIGEFFRTYAARTMRVLELQIKAEERAKLLEEAANNSAVSSGLGAQ